MKKRLIFFILLSILFSFNACGASNDSLEPAVPKDLIDPPEPPRIEASYDYLSFEETLSEFPPTDVVIVQYVGHRPFGQHLTEFEFIVSERILGNAAERIFVYAENGINANVDGSPGRVNYHPGDLTFTPGTDYLLPLRKAVSPYANTHEDGFTFIRNIVIDLKSPENSTMYSEPLALHITGLDFRRRVLPRQEIISYVEKLTRDNLPAIEPIRSEFMEDIIHGSPNVWIVEINEPLRLNSDVPHSDWMATDIYFVTVVESLKGDTETPSEQVVIFFADTVFSGEQHIVAVRPIAEGSTWHDFTSRNSLFRMDQLDEILAILAQQ